MKTHTSKAVAAAAGIAAIAVSVPLAVTAYGPLAVTAEAQPAETDHLDARRADPRSAGAGL